jgi:Flp pilus assembly protein TadD
VSDLGQSGRLLYAVGVGLFGVALVAGVIQSLRVEGRLPAVDLLMKGSGAYINLLITRKDDKGAIEQLQMQSRLVPPDAETHELLGKLLGDQGRPEEARIHFQELVRLRPEDAQGHWFLGSTYLDTNQPNLAASCFTEAIRLNPQYPQAFNSLGLASAQLGELAEAEKCFVKAVELSPTFTKAQINLNNVRQALRASRNGAKKGEP